VRAVFARASAAAPCLLFFDELDAIAPPRGHDSTGVTDRVVNQLLTELDGVTALRGVSVVGATSRPDLVDAALLRPGRLDRLLFCGVPGRAGRRDVLRALARRTALSPDVDLAAAADAAAGLTGADLGALLSEAQLAAVHEALAAAGDADAGGIAPPPIAARHLAAALAAARPSLPEAERRRLHAIYDRFMSSRGGGGGGGGAAAGRHSDDGSGSGGGGGGDGLAGSLPGSRATLA